MNKIMNAQDVLIEIVSRIIKDNKIVYLEDLKNYLNDEQRDLYKVSIQLLQYIMAEKATEVE